jgi:hypothetical protein
MDGNLSGQQVIKVGGQAYQKKKNDQRNGGIAPAEGKSFFGSYFLTLYD